MLFDHSLTYSLTHFLSYSIPCWYYGLENSLLSSFFIGSRKCKWEKPESENEWMQCVSAWVRPFFFNSFFHHPSTAEWYNVCHKANGRTLYAGYALLTYTPGLGSRWLVDYWREAITVIWRCKAINSPQYAMHQQQATIHFSFFSALLHST